MMTIHVVLSLALTYHWTPQFDVKNAFLHGDLKEIFMEQPPRYTKKDPTEYVCKLNRLIYGLKQAPRTWFQNFHDVVPRCGFQ